MGGGIGGKAHWGGGGSCQRSCYGTNAILGGLGTTLHPAPFPNTFRWATTCLPGLFSFFCVSAGKNKCCRSTHAKGRAGTNQWLSLALDEPCTP